MAVKKFKPNTPTQRFKTVIVSEDITTSEPYRPLTKGKKRISARNNKGRITVRRRGGGHKRLYRIVDFKRNKIDIPATVETIEYDPNRSANIALVCYADGERRYILAPKNLKVGQKIITSEKAEIEIGNTLSLEIIPLGTNVHNVELQIGRGGQIVRSAGNSANISGRDGDYTLLKLPSGEVRKIHNRCKATIGVIGNHEHELRVLGKAGRSRWLGRRPKVRGVVMNPVDHPHGGGEGKTSGGRHPVTPWGKPTKGKKTRNYKKQSTKYIVKRRKS